MFRARPHLAAGAPWTREPDESAEGHARTEAAPVRVAATTAGLASNAPHTASWSVPLSCNGLAT